MCKKTRKTGVQKLVIIGCFTVLKNTQTEVKYKKNVYKNIKKNDNFVDKSIIFTNFVSRFIFNIQKQ